MCEIAEGWELKDLTKLLLRLGEIVRAMDTHNKHLIEMQGI